MTQPTAGFGQTRPIPRRPSDSASAHEPPIGVGPHGLGAGRNRRSELRQEILEIVRCLEVLVNACETDVGYGVDRGPAAPSRSRRSAWTGYPSRPCFPVAATMPEIIWSILSGSTGRFCIEIRTERFQLVAVEILALSIGLDHHEIAQLHALIGCEASRRRPGRNAAAGSRRDLPPGANPSPGYRHFRRTGQRIGLPLFVPVPHPARRWSGASWASRPPQHRDYRVGDKAWVVGISDYQMEGGQTDSPRRAIRREMRGNPPLMRSVAVFDQVDPLPRSENEASVAGRAPAGIRAAVRP